MQSPMQSFSVSALSANGTLGQDASSRQASFLSSPSSLSSFLPQSADQGSLLVSQFFQFYQAMMRLKAASTMPEFSSLPRPVEEVPEAAPVTERTWRQMVALLEEQEEMASRREGIFGIEIYKQAQYAMVSLADELFLHQEWAGKRQWPLLEVHFFHSHAAGEMFFKKLDVILLDRNCAELAAVYFFALALGFEGRYRGNDSGGILDLYRRQLFAVIFHHRPDLLARDRNLFRQSYSATLAQGEALRLPHPRKWWWLFAGVLAAWLIVAQLLWMNLTSPIYDRIEKVQQIFADGGPK